ncbi:hypothetical protein [Streptomyces cyaneofuscatus]|uniref:hypothetical protein n=1 Tax=Streptomyces cyaneofuscatus TaxID=66883 RepID=UPI00363CBD85
MTTVQHVALLVLSRRFCIETGHNRTWDGVLGARAAPVDPPLDGFSQHFPGLAESLAHFPLQGSAFDPELLLWATGSTAPYGRTA